MADAALRCIWDGTGFVPYGRFSTRIARERFGEGEFVEVAVVEERSDLSHRHQFAWVREAWGSLPERFAREPWARSPETLRKHALIMTQWADTDVIACATAAQAQGLVPALMRILLRRKDDYALIYAERSNVVVLTAKSQSYRAMGKNDFQRSKDDILHWIADLLEVAPETLLKVRAA